MTEREGRLRWAGPGAVELGLAGAGRTLPNGAEAKQPTLRTDATRRSATIVGGEVFVGAFLDESAVDS